MTDDPDVKIVSPPLAGHGPIPDHSLRSRKVQDGALLLPIVGMVLLMPPAVQVFAIEGTILGIPVPVAYVFGVWLALIVVAAFAATRLARLTDPPNDRSRD